MILIAGIALAWLILGSAIFLCTARSAAGPTKRLTLRG